MKIFLLITSLTSFVCSFGTVQARIVIEEAITQNEKSDIVESNDQFTILRIAPEPEKGFHWPYLIRLEKGDSFHPEVISLEMVNTGQPSNSYKFHEERAIRNISGGYPYDKKFRNKIVHMMPVVLRPLDDWKLYSHALDRDSLVSNKDKFQRIDLQVLAMIQDCREFLESEFEYNLDEKTIFRGFSAAGAFAQRMSVLHSEKTRFVVAGGFGGMPLLPITEFEGRSLRFPVGVADYKDLIGRSFSIELYSEVPRFFHLGDEDTNDATKYGDAYDPEDQELIHTVFGDSPQSRWNKCIGILNDLNTLNECHIDEGVGHSWSDEMEEKIEEFITRQFE